MKPFLERAAFYLTAASAVSILFSIAASQILLGLAFAALLLTAIPMRLPPIRLPLAAFMGWTILAVLVSVDPKSGMPQIRKFVVFLMLMLVYSTYRNLADIRNTVLIWAGIASVSALRGLFQFAQKYREAQALGRDFYNYYVGERITGFMSHWMTFGGETMIVLLMLASFLFLAPPSRWKRMGWFCAALLGLSLVLGFTRSIFLLGLPLGLAYLLWVWRRWLVLVIPLVAAAGVFAIPPLRERVVSVLQPHGERDSNEHRVITRRAGLRMIQANPIFGLGPEQPKFQFDKYLPADVHKPLPEGYYGHLHNIYLQFAAERGIPALLFLLWLIGKVVYDFAQGIRRGASPQSRFVLHGAIAVILAVLAEGYYEYNLGDSEVLTMFLTVTACGYAALEAKPDDPERA